MRNTLRYRHARIAFGAFALALGLLVGPLTMQSTHAYVSGCELDPEVYLSNGSVVTVNASLLDSISDVQGASFVLHVPSGLTVTGIVKDANAALENVTVVASGYSYYADTTVNTYTSGIPVTAGSTLSLPPQGWIQQGSTTGLSNQDLFVFLKPRGGLN